jgi:hypothetical protein
VQLPYEKGFNEKKIPTKERPIQMNKKNTKILLKKIKLMNFSKIVL